MRLLRECPIGTLPDDNGTVWKGRGQGMGFWWRNPVGVQRVRVDGGL